MNIYVASKFENYATVRWVNDRLRDSGHVVTWDWTRTDEFDEAGVVKASGLSPEHRRMYGMLDYAGVMQAELVFMIDHPKLNGARWEAGIAIGNGAEVWIANYHNSVIFDVLPQVRTWPDLDTPLSLLADTSTVV